VRVAAGERQDVSRTKHGDESQRNILVCGKVWCMADQASNSGSSDVAQKPSWIIVEAWREDRAINRLVIADAIKCVIAVICVSLVAYADRLAPGATPERLHLFEAYHFYTVFALSVFFTICLFVEVTLILFRRIKKVANTDA